MSKPLSILIVADGHGGVIYDEALAGAFLRLGHKVERFTWKEYFHHYPYASVYPTDGNRVRSFWYRLQNRFTVGPAVCRLNRALLQQAEALQPDLVFIYRGTHVWPSTLRALKARTLAKVVGYNNDDPFSPRYPWHFWRHFRRGIPFYDHIFCYRQKNIAEYAALGYAKTSLLRSYYVDALNKPVPAAKKYACEVLFIGHYEDDGRDRAISLLMDNGLNVKLFGTGWDKSVLSGKFGPVKPLYNADYNLAICSAKMALVFLSKLNNDTYTRRCFEIPATGTAMVSEYTEDMATLFEPGKDAMFFHTPAELLKTVQDLLGDPKTLAAVGKAGRARLLRDGHEVTDRAREILVALGLR